MSSDVESQLGQIWSDLLGTGEVAPEADFFKLGGDSVIATMLLLRIEETFAVFLDPVEVFEHPTLRELASVVVQSMPQPLLAGAEEGVI
jgi:acyl carrier protein